MESQLVDRPVARHLDSGPIVGLYAAAAGMDRALDRFRRDSQFGWARVELRLNQVREVGALEVADLADPPEFEPHILRITRAEVLDIPTTTTPEVQ